MDRWTAYYKIMLDFEGKVTERRETDTAYEFVIGFIPSENHFWATLYHAVHEDGSEPVMVLKK